MILSSCSLSASALFRCSCTPTFRRNLGALVNGSKPLIEPLHLTVDDGYGFARIKPGYSLGHQNRFLIVRRLGWGMYSSTWLAKDRQDAKYVAIKVLTGFATSLCQEGLSPEVEVLRKLSASPTGAEPKKGHCLSLHSNFLYTGQAGTGPHLCLVTDAFGGDVERLKRIYAPNGFPFGLAKRILFHTLKGLVTTHKQGIVHTDLKHDNILFDRADTDLNVEPEKPLPVPSADKALDRTFVIGDFGNAQFIGNPIFDEISAEALRAPETVLRGPWDEKVDIWTFGCLAFEFLHGRPLFKKHSYSKHLTAEKHLWDMQCVTEESFQLEQLGNSRLGHTYFNDSCQLRFHPPLASNTIFEILSNSNILDTAQLQASASFIHRCLRLNPRDRASAEELLDDPFWEGVDERAFTAGA